MRVAVRVQYAYVQYQVSNMIHSKVLLNSCHLFAQFVPVGFFQIISWRSILNRRNNIRTRCAVSGRGARNPATATELLLLLYQSYLSTYLPYQGFPSKGSFRDHKSRSVSVLGCHLKPSLAQPERASACSRSLLVPRYYTRRFRRKIGGLLVFEPFEIKEGYPLIAT